MTDRERVESYIPIAKFIAAICGPRCEVVLHCFDDLDHSIVFIENGDVTGRQVGDGLIDFVLGSTFNKNYRDRDFIVNQRGRHTKDNKTLRFSSFYIKDDNNEAIGFLGVNMDVTPLLKMKSLIDSELFFRPEDSGLIDAGDGQAISASNMVEAAFQDVFLSLGFTDASQMTREDKKKVIGMLNSRNLFVLKGVVNISAKKLQISEPSVYRYLRELKDSGNIY